MNRFITITLLLVVTAACTGSPAGTGVSNPPTVPTTSYAPDFDENVDVTAVTSEDTDADISALTTTQPEVQYLSGPASDWQDLFVEGPVYFSRLFRDRFKTFGDELAEAVAEDEDFELGTDDRTVLVGTTRLVDAFNPWRVVVNSTASGLIRVVVINREDGRVWGYYLFVTDDDGNPVRGYFAFVNFDHIQNPDAPGVRFLGIAFDFSDDTTPRLVTSVDYYHEALAHGVSFLLLQECEREDETCRGELLFIRSTPPDRELSTDSVRFSWDRDSHEVCAANIAYGSSEATLGETQSFIGPEAPGEDAVTTGICPLTDFSWADTIFSEGDLPLRYEDTSTPGGFARTIAGDDSTLVQWESVLTESILDDWLDGVF